MKRILISIVALFALCAGASAQDTWFCSVPGTTLTYAIKDATNGKVSNFDYVIKVKETSGPRTTITYDVVMPGQKPVKGCKVWTEDGIFHMDASALIGKLGEGANAAGNAPKINEYPKVGMVFADCGISVESLMLSSDYTNIKMTAHENITVPAGTFDCWCLEYDLTDKVMGMKAENHVKQWMAKGVGDVKVVTADKRGRLVSEKVLQKIAQ